MYTDLETGRIADSLLILRDNKVILNTWEFFNPNKEEDLKLVYNRLRNIKKGSVVIYGLYTQHHNPEFGNYFMKVIVDDETFEAFRDSFNAIIEYKIH